MARASSTGVPQPVIRILSDLHYGDGSSWLRSLWSLRPLFEGADTVIINGDATDSQSDENASAVLAEVKAFFSAHVPNPVFITGNHDPDISDIHELSLANDSIWITHGDVLFEDIAPWGQLVKEHRHRLDRLGAHLSPAERATIETRLKLHRLACFNSKHGFVLSHRDFVHRAVRLARTVLPPQRIVAMMRAWRDTPRLAADLAEAQRPNAKFILLGHTHFPGVWRQAHGRVVINTGSFSTPYGPYVTEISGEHLRVRSVLRRGDHFYCGATRAQFALAAEAISAIRARA